MRPSQWIAVGAVASMPFAVAAQQARPDPIDANATVPAAAYKSAFESYQRAGSEAQPSADKVWRKANEEVAKAGPHNGHAAPHVPAPAPDKALAGEQSKH